MLADGLILPPEDACCRVRPLDCDEDAVAEEEVLFPSEDRGFVSEFSPTRTAQAFVLWYDRFTMLETEILTVVLLRSLIFFNVTR